MVALLTEPAVPGSNPASRQAHGKLCRSLGGFPPEMAQYRGLPSEGGRSAKKKIGDKANKYEQ
jgi:hypothetical protein